MSARLRFNRTVTFVGKQDSNYPKDLDIEHNNKLIKSEVHSFRGHITDRTLDRISKSILATDKVVRNMDKQGNVRRPSGKHAKMDTSDDVQILVKQFQQEDLFVFIPGRCHSAFPKIASNPLAVLENDKLKQWLYISLRDISERHFYQ